MPVQWPSSVDRLVLVVKDSDKDLAFGSTGDDTLGSIRLSLKELAKRYSNPGGGLVWMNIYGAPTGTFDHAAKKKMNANPELASLWKGRILMHIEVIDTESPEVSQQKVDPSYYQSHEV